MMAQDVDNSFLNCKRDSWVGRRDRVSRPVSAPDDLRAGPERAACVCAHNDPLERGGPVESSDLTAPGWRSGGADVACVHSLSRD
jgi:hypothetical protein